jgi:hypothetical protein
MKNIIHKNIADSSLNLKDPRVFYTNLFQNTMKKQQITIEEKINTKIDNLLKLVEF